MNPLLDFISIFEPSIGIIIFATIVLGIINLCYKYLVNQKEAKIIKLRIKELSEEMKKYQKEKNIEKVNEILRESMQENSKLMRMTMKPMLISFIVIIILLPGIANLFVYSAPLINNVGNVTINNEIYYVEKSDGLIIVKGNDFFANFSTSTKVNKQISGGAWYISYKQGGLFGGPERVEFERVVAFLPGFSLPIVGNDFGWLGWYILVSIPLAIIIRKVLGIVV